jgi:hypothetical protein
MKPGCRDEKPEICCVAEILSARRDVVAILASVAELDLPDCWVGAGLIRNAVWDAVSHNASPQLPSDIDVVYFDRRDAALERDRVLEILLLAAHPGPIWSVKNQARMHERAGEAPYFDTADAISRWPETCTAVAARLVRGRIEILAPWGLTDLLSPRDSADPELRT